MGYKSLSKEKEIRKTKKTHTHTKMDTCFVSIVLLHNDIIKEADMGSTIRKHPFQKLHLSKKNKVDIKVNIVRIIMNEIT